MYMLVHVCLPRAYDYKTMYITSIKIEDKDILFQA